MRSFFPLSIVHLLLCVAGCGEAREPDPAPRSSWHLVREGKLARLECERTLYVREGDEHFFVRLRVTNLGARPLGIDVRDDQRVPRPNQWGGMRTPGRGAIDELREITQPLDEEARRGLRAAFAAGLLARLPVASSFDVYAEFNASGRQAVEAVDRPYVYVSLDGQLLVTDGTDVEQLSLEWIDAEDSPTTVVIPAPVPWREIPKEALVLTRS